MATVNATSTNGGQTSVPDTNALKTQLEDLSASDEAVMSSLNSVLSNDKSSPEQRQAAVRFFQQRQEKESLLSQVIRAMGDTAMRIIGNIR